MDRRAAPRHLTPKQWEKVKERNLAGERISEIAKDYGITPKAIYCRRDREGWEKPNASGGGSGGLNPYPGTKDSSSNPDSLTKVSGANPDQPTKDSPQSLLEIARNSTPEEFQKRYAEQLQTLIAEGLVNLEAPRNWSEMRTAATLWRATTGLDKPQEGGPRSLIVNVGAGLVKREAAPRIIEIPPEAEEWEP
jgi:hypothetical protein